MATIAMPTNDMRAADATPGRYSEERMERDSNDLDNDGKNSNHQNSTATLTTVDAETLIEALALLTDFATLDSATYQSSFSFPTPTNAAARQQQQSENTAASEQIQRYRRSLRRLEQVLVQKNVRQSAPQLPALWRALHRLHSNLAILQENEARHAQEMKTLRDEYTQTKQQNSKLKKAVRVLKDRNESLERKLLKKQSLLKQARDFFRNSQELQKNLEQQNTQIKLQAHEQFLLQSSRVRLESTDSNFSDADALLFPEQGTAATTAPTPGTTTSTCLSTRTLPLEEETDSASLDSAGSCSLITDEGGTGSATPVVKLFSVHHHHQNQPQTPQGTVGDGTATSTTTIYSSQTTNSDLSTSSLDDLYRHSSLSCHLPGGPLNHPMSPCRPGVYKLWYPLGQFPPLRFLTIPLNELPAPPRGSLTQEILKGQEELETEEDDDDDGNFTATTRTTTATARAREGTFRLGLPNLVGGANRSPSPPTIPEEAETPASVIASGDDHKNNKNNKRNGHAFVVSAYVGSGFHSELPRPTLGARVVEINGRPVNPFWSYRQFLEEVSKVSGINAERIHRESLPPPIMNQHLSDAHPAKPAADSSQDEDNRNKEAGHNIKEGGVEADEVVVDTTTTTTTPQEIVTTDEDESSAVSSIDKVPTFFISFRNDALTKKQRERLSSSDRSLVDVHNKDGAASSTLQTDQQQPSTNDLRPRSFGETSVHKPDQPQSKGFGLGFLRLGGGGASNRNVDDPLVKDRCSAKDKEAAPTLSGASELPAPPTSKSDHQPPPTTKGKNPLFFWDRGDKSQEKKKDAEDRHQPEGSAHESEPKDSADIKEHIDTCPALLNKTPASDTEKQQEESNTTEKVKNNDGGKRPSKGLAGVIPIPFFTPPKRTSSSLKNKNPSDRTDSVEPAKKSPTTNDDDSLKDSSPRSATPTEDQSAIKQTDTCDSTPPNATKAEQPEPSLGAGGGGGGKFGVSAFWRTASPKMPTATGKPNNLGTTADDHLSDPAMS